MRLVPGHPGFVNNFFRLSTPHAISIARSCSLKPFSGWTSVSSHNACQDQSFQSVFVRPSSVTTPSVKAQREPSFVQVQMPESDARVVIELSAPSGDRMRIESRDAAQLDVVGMVQAFWSRAS